MKKLLDSIIKINNKYEGFISKKPQKFIFQFLPKNPILILLFIILLIIFIPKVLDNNTIAYRNQNFGGFHDAIYNENIEQEIKTFKIKKIDSLGIFFATYQRKNNSNYKLIIKEDNKEIYNKKFKSNKLNDLSYHYFNINLRVKKGKKYKYVILPLSVKKNQAITVGINKNKSLIYEIKNKSEFYSEVIILSVLLLMVFFIINYLVNNKIIKSEKRFLLIMLPYFISALFIIPAYEVPDEPYHFHKAYRLSQYDIRKLPTTNMVKAKNSVPENLDCLFYSYGNNYENILEKQDLKRCFASKNNKKQLLINSGDSKFIAYSAGALGIRIADVFTNSPMIIFYLGRLFNFLLSFLIILYAINQIPRHKKLVLGIVCVPMFIQQMISYSYDSLLNSLCVLVICYFIKFYYQDTHIKRTDLICYMLSSILILDIKAPYVLLSLPILLLNKEKFGEKRYSKIISIIFFLISLLVSYIIINKIISIGSIALTKNVSNIGNTIDSLFSIKRLLKIVYKTLVVHGVDYINSFISIFGWLSVLQEPIIIWSYIIFLIILALSDKSEIDTKNKILILLMDIVLIGGIFLVMYLSWTETGSYVIEGVQGRYFLPIALSLLLVIIPKKEKFKMSANYVYNFINISMLFFLITILNAFY